MKTRLTDEEKWSLCKTRKPADGICRVETEYKIVVNG